MRARGSEDFSRMIINKTIYERVRPRVGTDTYISSIIMYRSDERIRQVFGFDGLDSRKRIRRKPRGSISVHWWGTIEILDGNRSCPISNDFSCVIRKGKTFPNDSSSNMGAKSTKQICTTKSIVLRNVGRILIGFSQLFDILERFKENYSVNK